MDDIKTNVTNEAKIKDGYTQLSEKMDQVKNQVARMERKYDELYQAVKEKDTTKTGSVSHETSSSEQQTQDVKTHRDNMLTKSPSRQIIKPDDSPKVMDTKEETSNATSPTADMDIEKMEDNPFV